MARARSKTVRMAGTTALLILVSVILTLLVTEPAASPSHADADTGTKSVAAAAPVRGTHGVQRLTIGHSVIGRRIDAYEVTSASAGRALLVFGCIDGDEPAGIAIARHLLRSEPPAGRALWIVPDLNPDGVAAGTRVNAHLVDLNRNFPWHWRPLGPRGSPQYAGPRPLSEPESQAAHALILRVRPRITIWFHQPTGLVDLSGGDPGIERRFARLVGLPVARLERYPGSAASWSNSVMPGTTAFVVELPAGALSRALVARYVRAVLMLARFA